MKIRLLSLAALLYLFAPQVFAQKTEASLALDSGVAAHAGIDAIYRGFTEAYRKLDADAAAGLYTETAAYLAPDAGIAEGRESVRANFASFFDMIRKDGAKLAISFRIVQRRVSGDMAYDVGVYTLRTVRDDKPGPPSQGKFVTVAVRDKKGVWRFQVDGYSGLPTPK